MKARRIILGILVILVGLVVAGWVFLNGIKKRALPDYNQTIVLDGQQGHVEVFRDSFAIPHVYAENEADLYRAVGYVMSQDRMWQMDLLRRVTSGRLAEIFGEDMVDVDQLMRALRIMDKSRELWKKAEPGLQTALSAFCEGVNQYIRDYNKKLPPEFALLGYKPEPWLPEQSISLIGYMAWDLSTGWTTEVLMYQLQQQLPEELYRYLLPDMDEVQTVPVFPEFSGVDGKAKLEVLKKLAGITEKMDALGLDIFRGSNNWAVSGKKSVTGKPLLANDMHLGLMIPGVWYQMHEVVPGKVNVTGVVLPGQPLVVAGHNEKIAWGFTNVMVDDADFYAETVDPDDPAKYKVDGVWRKMEMSEEMILTKSGDTIYRTNRFTHRGPVISGLKKIDKPVISMSWIGNLPSNELRTVYLLNRADNWEEFREALKTFVSVNQNVIYADVEGNIGLQSTIGLPVRHGVSRMVYPGDTSAYDWTAIVPFEELPYTYNPESGMVSSANNKTVGPDYPYYISRWYDLPYRIKRIRELLTEKQKLSVDDFKRIQADETSIMARSFVPVFLKALGEPKEWGGTPQEALNLLRSWDYNMGAESGAAAIFDELYYRLFALLAGDQMDRDAVTKFGSERTLVKNFMENMLHHPDNGWCDDTTTADHKEDFTEMIRKAFIETVDALSDEMGVDPTQWQWGKIHTFTIKHPMAKVALIDRIFGLSRGSYAVGGSFHTVCPYSYPMSYPFPDLTAVNHGASERHVFDLSNWDHSQTVIPTGTSGIPASKHFCDQTEMYVKNLYHADPFSRTAVEAAQKYHTEVTGK